MRLENVKEKYCIEYMITKYDIDTQLLSLIISTSGHFKLGSNIPIWYRIEQATTWCYQFLAVVLLSEHIVKLLEKKLFFMS